MCHHDVYIHGYSRKLDKNRKEGETAKIPNIPGGRPRRPARKHRRTRNPKSSSRKIKKESNESNTGELDTPIEPKAPLDPESSETAPEMSPDTVERDRRTLIVDDTQTCPPVPTGSSENSAQRLDAVVLAVAPDIVAPIPFNPSRFATFHSDPSTAPDPTSSQNTGG